MPVPVAALLAVTVAFVTALAVTRWLTRAGIRRRLVDIPNERSLHEHPTPRGGGLGILAGVVAGLAVLSVGAGVSPPDAWLGVAAAALAGVSLLDDLRTLPALSRLAVHVLAAATLLAAGWLPDRLTLLPGWDLPVDPGVTGVVAVLYIVWMLNLYNFMDGMDGLAGTMAVVGFSGFAVLGAIAGAWSFAGLSLLVACAAAGFLVFNLPPARIFLGDVGSVPLGFLAAALTLQAQRDGVFPFWLGVLVFSPFIVDASVTLCRRLVARERVWTAHRSHYYQRLVRAGWGHGRTLRWETALMICCAVSAVSVSWLDDETLSVAVGAAWLIGYTTLALALPRLWTASGGAAGGQRGDGADHEGA